MATAEPFSVEKDIQPLKEKFFKGVMNDSRMNPLGAAKMAIRFSDSLDSIVEERQKKDMRAMQMESASLALDRARDSAAKERDMLTNLAPLQKQLTAILEDPSGDPNTKQKALSQIGVQNAGLLATNPAAGLAFNSALRGIGDDPEKTKPKTTAAAFISAGGSYDALAEYSKRTGTTLDANTELPFEVFAKGLESAKQGKLKSMADAEAREKQEKELKERVKDLVSSVKKVELYKPDPTMLPDKVDENKFATPMDDAVIGGVIQTLGSPDEKSAAAKANAKTRLEIAQRISGEYIAGKRTPTYGAETAAPSAADLFTK